MTKADIIKKLNNIYRIRKTWNGAPGPFDRKSIKKRESIFICQRILECLLRQPEFISGSVKFKRLNGIPR